MSREEILAKLTDVFRDVFDDDELVLTEETTKEDIEGWDSLANINLVVSIEDEFDISFSMDNIIGIEDVGSLIDVIAEGVAK
jgi:acyl carrier protein